MTLHHLGEGIGMTLHLGDGIGMTLHLGEGKGMILLLGPEQGETPHRPPADTAMTILLLFVRPHPEEGEMTILPLVERRRGTNRPSVHKPKLELARTLPLPVGKVEMTILLLVPVLL
jgi:hypothetical protein